MTRDSSDRTIGELALALHTAPGRFALLLGSGVSVESGIPTGWGVMNDIIRKLAVASGAGEVDEPLSWYAKEYEEDADYSRLLERVSPAPDQRRALLAGYFEPTDADRDAGRKTTTVAHRAIAQLVARGTVRVIVTTNFDRLLEQALSAAGVEPVVVSTAAAAEGAPPLVHERCVVIKVHGDYLDPNIRNTLAELEHYEPAMDRLLDEVFADYGLIVCGWSARWDVALRRAMERAQSRRYATYWTTIDPPDPVAVQLVTHRAAHLLPITGADAFFGQVVDRLSALDDMSARGVLGVDAAVAEAKRFIADPAHRIRLHDLISELVDRVRATLTFDGNGGSDEDYKATVRSIDRQSAELNAVLATVAYFATDDDQIEILARAVRRMCTASEGVVSGYTAWVNLRRYPALLALYSVGLGAAAAERWEIIARVLDQKFTEPTVSASPTEPLASWLRAFNVLNSAIAQQLLENRSPIAISVYLATSALEHLAAVLRLDRAEFDDLFDDWEYLLASIQWLLGANPHVGRFVVRRQPMFEFEPHDRLFRSARPALERRGVIDEPALDEKLGALKKTLEDFSTKIRLGYA